MTSSNPNHHENLEDNLVDNNKIHFFHYNKGMYMGDMNKHLKNGKGLLIADNNICMISQYVNDIQCSHNLVIRTHSLTSIIFASNRKCQVVYRCSQYLLLLQFPPFINTAQGNGILIDYKQKILYYLRYYKGKLQNAKKQSNIKIIQQVFSENNLTKLIRKEHIEALNININTHSQIQIRFTSKNTIKIGFFNKEGQFQGLGCQFNLKFHNSHLMELNMIEQGYYHHGYMDNFGIRKLQNNNQYIGQFKNDHFDGQGIIINQKNQSWQSGTFKQGKRTNQHISSHQIINDLQNLQKCNKLKEQLKLIHCKQLNNYIDQKIFIVSDLYLNKRISDIIPHNQNYHQFQTQVIYNTNKYHQSESNKIDLQRKYQSQIIEDKNNENEHQKQHYSPSFDENSFQNIKNDDIVKQNINLDKQDPKNKNSPYLKKAGNIFRKQKRKIITPQKQQKCIQHHEQNHLKQHQLEYLSKKQEHRYQEYTPIKYLQHQQSQLPIKINYNKYYTPQRSNKPQNNLTSNITQYQLENSSIYLLLKDLEQKSVNRKLDEKQFESNIKNYQLQKSTFNLEQQYKIIMNKNWRNEHIKQIRRSRWKERQLTGNLGRLQYAETFFQGEESPQKRVGKSIETVLKTDNRKKILNQILMGYKRPKSRDYQSNYFKYSPIKYDYTNHRRQFIYLEKEQQQVINNILSKYKKKSQLISSIINEQDKKKINQKQLPKQGHIYTKSIKKIPIGKTYNKYTTQIKKNNQNQNIEHHSRPTNKSNFYHQKNEKSFILNNYTKWN